MLSALTPIARNQPPPKKVEVPAFEEDDPCRLTVDSGNCQSYQDQWYFDPFAGSCHRFTYSGCGGNRNRYGSEAECVLRCAHLAKPGFLGKVSTITINVMPSPPGHKDAPPPQPRVPAAQSAGRKAFSEFICATLFLPLPCCFDVPICLKIFC